jgi:hypothetical protein
MDKIDVSGNRLKFSWYFNHGIDTVKITALSNHKPGILNYIRIGNRFDHVEQILCDDFQVL